MEVADQADVPDVARPAHGEELVMVEGDVLMREGEVGDDIFEIVDGAFEILRGAEQARVGTVSAGTTVGEIAALAGCARTATVRALERCVVRRLDSATYQGALAMTSRRWPR